VTTELTSALADVHGSRAVPAARHGKRLSDYHGCRNRSDLPLRPASVCNNPRSASEPVAQCGQAQLPARLPHRLDELVRRPHLKRLAALVGRPPEPSSTTTCSTRNADNRAESFGAETGLRV
jgi:hypothetical protein